MIVLSEREEQPFTQTNGLNLPEAGRAVNQTYRFFTETNLNILTWLFPGNHGISVYV